MGPRSPRKEEDQQVQEIPYLGERLVGLREVPTTCSLKAIELKQPAPFLGDGEGEGEGEVVMSQQKGYTHRASDFGGYLGAPRWEASGWGRSGEKRT